MAILSLLPLVVVVVHLTVFACKRDLHTLFYGLGTIGNGVLNYILKHTIKEPRPEQTIHIRDSTKACLLSLTLSTYLESIFGFQIKNFKFLCQNIETFSFQVRQILEVCLKMSGFFRITNTPLLFTKYNMNFQPNINQK